MDSRTAACLRAVRDRAGTMSSIALRAKLTIKEASASLADLAAAGLVHQTDRYRWEATPGHTPATRRLHRRTNAVRPGSSAERLLSLLDRAGTGIELAGALGVTLQRVRQLVVQLSAHGLVQVGDPDKPLRAVWRTGDKVVVLGATAVRVLSAIPERRGTTSRKIAVATRLAIEEVEEALRDLRKRGFVLRDEHVFTLTGAGFDHWQRRTKARRADPPALPVRSDRVRSVLTYLSEEGPTRTRNVGDALGISRTSVNALMQYLKRKGLVRKCDGGLNAPHELTEAGRKTLATLTLDRAA